MRTALILISLYLQGCCLLDSVSRANSDIANDEIHRDIDELCLGESLGGETTYRKCLQAWED